MKILLADDHSLFRDGVKQLFTHLHTQAQVIEADNGAEVMRLSQTQPDFDLVLLDIGMPGVDGFSGLASFRKNAPSVPVVILSGSEDPDDVRSALDGGAAGFIPKSSSSDVILSALRLVLSGGIYTPPGLLNGQHTQVTKEQLNSLTPRQREVLVLLGHGRSNKEIAKTMGLTEATVKQHVSAILKSLKVSNRMQAVIAGRRLKLSENT